MRRKTTKELIKRNLVSIALSGILILMGVYLLYLSKLPVTPYEAYQEKTITVDSIRYHYYMSSGYWELRTEDGECYNLTGSFQASELKEKLTPGTEVQIRYGENWVGNLFGYKYAEEVTVNGKRIVSYNNDEDRHLTALYILSGGGILLGAAGLFLFRWEVRRNRELQRKRDHRIEKKYGRKQGK